MKAVILAGGFGTRISEESHLKPKPMIEIGGMPILWHIMKYYSSYGFNEFIICSGYKQHVIKDFFKNYFLRMTDVTFDFTNGIETIKAHKTSTEEWKVTIADTGLNTMTGGRIKRIKKYLDDEPFLLTYGDGLSDVNLDALVRFHKSHGKLATITVVSAGQRFGVIKMSGEDKITDTPASTFPGKLTQLLYKRFELGLGGFVFLPCELIENNGTELKSCILKYADLWDLGQGFKNWIENDNIFTNTLVDRINTGYPREEKIDVGFDDKMLNTSEYFHLWVIDGYEGLFSELPFDKCGLNVILTKELKKYRTIKVRILNGSHTSMIPYALLRGVETVGDCLADPVMSAHLKACQEEIVCSLDMDKNETEQYARDVMTRFRNPYIRHMCQSIALNSVSKFKVRVLPSILDYERKYGKTPKTLMFSFGKLIEFYKRGTPNDDPIATEKMQKGTVREILADVSLWGEDLTRFACEVEGYANTQA